MVDNSGTDALDVIESNKMPPNQNGEREAHIAALSFGLLFMCMLGLLAISETGNQTTVTAVAVTDLPHIR